MTTLAEIAGTTDIDRVTRVVAEAGNRMKRLEGEAELAFTQWLEAQALADEAGVVVDLKLGSGIAAALSEFKQRRERKAAKSVVDEEWSSARVAGASSS